MSNEGNYNLNKYIYNLTIIYICLNEPNFF